jgi:hypothetical protein
MLRLGIAILRRGVPARKLDAALRYLVTYLDESLGAEAIGVDPEFARRGLG